MKTRNKKILIIIFVFSVFLNIGFILSHFCQPLSKFVHKAAFQEYNEKMRLAQVAEWFRVGAPISRAIQLPPMLYEHLNLPEETIKKFRKIYLQSNTRWAIFQEKIMDLHLETLTILSNPDGLALNEFKAIKEKLKKAYVDDIEKLHSLAISNYQELGEDAPTYYSLVHSKAKLSDAKLEIKIEALKRACNNE